MRCSNPVVAVSTSGVRRTTIFVGQTVVAAAQRIPTAAATPATVLADTGGRAVLDALGATPLLAAVIPTSSCAHPERAHPERTHPERAHPERAHPEPAHPADPKRSRAAASSVNPTPSVPCQPGCSYVDGASRIVAMPTRG